MSSIAEILRTENEDEQVQLVGKLIGMAQAPTTVMTLLFDERVGHVTITSSQIYIEGAYKILEMARQELLRMEREALQPKEKEQLVTGEVIQAE